MYNISLVKPNRAKFHTPNAILRKAIAPSDAGFAREGSHVAFIPNFEGRPVLHRPDIFGAKSLRCYGFWHMIPWVEDAGWHLSYFGGVGTNINKIRSYSDGVDLGVAEDKAEEVVMMSVRGHCIYVCIYCLHVYLHWGASVNARLFLSW
jgi:hypothetical protein